MQFTHSILDYFKKDSPDFINYKGRSLDGPQQVEALAQAQSIGMYDQCVLGDSDDNSLYIVYLSIFLTQCFNVSGIFLASI